MKLPVLCEGDYRGSGSITPVDVGSDYSALSIFPIWLSVSITTHHPIVSSSNWQPGQGKEELTVGKNSGA